MFAHSRPPNIHLVRISSGSWSFLSLGSVLISSAHSTARSRWFQHPLVRSGCRRRYDHLPADTAPAPQAAPAEPAAAEPARHTALSLIGEPKFGPDFKHFDWVNPDAPKGGVVRFSNESTFDSSEPLLDQGMPAGPVAMIYDSLMTGSPDEESTEYGLIAEWISHPPD